MSETLALWRKVNLATRWMPRLHVTLSPETQLLQEQKIFI